MSEHPRDDEELQSFLKGDSELSRRYKDASGEQPPAKVDAAILAASQWAVGAEPGQGGRRSTASSPGGGAHGGAKWWDRLFSRWSVPLATAAVVVIAATLTLMIERDPELERIERDYDGVALNAPDERPDDAEQEMARQDSVAEADEASPQASPQKPVAATVNAKPAEPEQVKPAPERLAFRPVEQETAVAVGDSAARKREADSKEAAGATGRAAMPAEPALGEIAGNVTQAAAPPAAGSSQSTEEKSMVADIAATSERRRESDALRAGDVAPADMASEQVSPPDAAVTDAFSPVETIAEAPEPADASGVSSQAEIVEQDGATAPPGIRSARTQTPPSSDARGTARDPEQWIADIEEQLALGNRELARAAVRNFRERYPDYELPDALEELLPVNDPETGAPDMGDQ